VESALIGFSIERRLDRVKVPVLGIAGWHDDARGTIRNYEIMSRLKNAPLYHVVMDASAHKGIDYVNGYFGPQARIDRRELQLRWMDHYLKGVDNGVDKEPALDIFVIGDNLGGKNVSGRWRGRYGQTSTCARMADLRRQLRVMNRRTSTPTIPAIPLRSW